MITVINTYPAWVADGSPYRQCQPALDLVAMLRRHGYTGPATGYPDLAHLTANPPEDHTPFSHTPWPGPQPYPYGMAYDVMPDSAVDWRMVGQRLVADKLAGHPALACVKYVNWTDVDGRCWHDSWMPNHARYPSSDTGHVHISFRTDYVTSTIMSGWRPFAEDEMLVLRDSINGAVYTTNGVEYYHVPDPGAYAVLLAATGKRGPDYEAAGLSDNIRAFGVPVGTGPATVPAAWPAGHFTIDVEPVKP